MEFLNLQLTDQMTVDELIKLFNEKMRFAKEWVPDEQSQIQHFIGALPPEYRSAVRLATSLTQAFSMARATEDDIKSGEKMNRIKVAAQKTETDQSGSQQKKKRGKNQKRKLISGGTSQKSRWCFKCKFSHTGLCTAQTMRCVRCGTLGHEVKNCNFLQSVCWNCQKEGHVVEKCTEEKKFGSGVKSGIVGGSSSAGQKRKNP